MRENKGQWPEQVIGMRHLGGGLLFFEKNKLHYQFRELPDRHAHDREELEREYWHHNFNVEFLEANPSPTIEKRSPSTYYHNYFIGNDPSKWGRKARDFEGLKYHDLYQDIDLEYYIKNGNVKFDLHIAAGASIEQIKFKYDGGVDLRMEEDNLIVSHKLGDISELKPYAFQIVAGEEVEVECNFVLKRNTVSYEFPNGYNEKLDLVIDPEVIYFTYSGSGYENFGMTATDDSLGNGYTGGTVFGSGYATTTGAYSTSFTPHPNGNRTTDIAISKFSQDGSRLLYGTYLGGNRAETIHSMVVDASNDSMNLFIMGATSSSNYPTSFNAHNRVFSGSGRIFTETATTFDIGADIVISKLDSSGSFLLGSTFFGGDSLDGLNSDVERGSIDYNGLIYNYGDSHRGEIIIDKNGDCLIASSTRTPNLTASLNNISGSQDGLIAKFSNQLDSIVWCRYLGGSSEDAIYSIKVLDSNKILVGGGTNSHLDFPSDNNSYKPSSSGGRSEGFISVISSDGATIEKTTFLGTSAYDQVFFVEFDRFQNIYALGQTNGGNFPLKKVDNITSFEADTGAGQFIVKLNRDLDSAIFSMTFGDGLGIGTPNISPTAFLVDRCQNVFAAGWGGALGGGDGPLVLSDSMPITPDAFDKTTDNQDFYFYVLNRDADRVYYATYFGKNNVRDHVDGGTSRFDKDGVVYQSLCADCGGNRTNYAPVQSQNVYAFTNRVVLSSNICSNSLLKFDMSLAPKAGFSVSATERCLAPGDTIQIRIKDDSYRADQYNWNFFGNQVQGPLPNGDTVLIFNSPGFYTINQEITDTICLLNDSSKIIIEIRPDDITLSPTNDTVVCFGDSLLVTAGASNTAGNFHWSRSPQFTDTLSLFENYKHPLQPGTDTLYLKVFNLATNACEKFDTVLVDYFPINYTATLSEDTICENSIVQLSAALNNIDRYVWDFGNGQKDSTTTVHTIKYGSPGNYNITLEVENFVCNARDTTTLPLNVFINDISLNVINDTLVCRQDSLLINQTASGTGINSYLWSSDSSFSDTLNNYPSDGRLEVQQTGIDTFYIKVSNRFCYANEDLKVEIVPFQLELEALPDESCTPFRQELSTTIINADSFRIFLGDGSSTNTDPTPEIFYDSPGVYTVSLLGYNAQCSIADTIERSIPVYQGVELSFLNDTTICNDANLPLSILHGNTATSFIWSEDPGFSNPLNNPQDSSIVVSPSSSTTYFYRGMNGICDADSSINVGVDNVNVDLSDFESICLEDTIAVTAQGTAGFPPISYTWTPNADIISGQNTSTILISPNSNKKYYLTISDQLNCTDTASSTIEVNIPRFEDALILSASDTIYKGQQLQFSTNRNLSGLSYQWSPPEYFNDPLSPNPIGRFPENTTVSVTITDQQTGCVVESQKRIGVFEINCSIPDIFVPTAFTPNGDGNNDMVFVRGLVLESFELSIYNRWGEKVFETSSFNNGWDGNYKGKAADPGVFVYHLKAVCFDGQEYTDKGNITLIR